MAIGEARQATVVEEKMAKRIRLGPKEKRIFRAMAHNPTGTFPLNGIADAADLPRDQCGATVRGMLKAGLLRKCDAGYTVTRMGVKSAGW